MCDNNWIYLALQLFVMNNFHKWSHRVVKFTTNRVLVYLCFYGPNFPITKHVDHAYTSKADTRLNALGTGTQFYKNVKRQFL